MASVKSPRPGQSALSASVLSSAASGYFNEQYLQPQPAVVAHAPHPQQASTRAPSHSPSRSPSSGHLPARSPYTESQNFMPTTARQPTVLDDSETVLNTRANAHIPPTTLAATTAPAVASSPLSAQHADSTTAPNGTMSTAAAAPNGRFAESWDASQRGSSIDNDGDGASIVLPGRTNTLRKKASVRRTGSLRRSSSRRSMKAGSMPSLALQSRSDAEDESHSAFYCPVPTKGSPTDVLANRFQAWRKILKDLIAYHREIQAHYEQRAKSVQRLSTTLNGLSLPPGFMTSGGLDDAAQVLRGFHKQSVSEANKAREIEEDVILALTGLRSDLSQKIKEIKSISGDFRNSVDKEMDATRRAVKSLQETLGQAELDPSLTTGRQDPYLLRLAADRQLERQLQEENYLHQAFLNLEKSGRELESIVVGEIQKSYNAYASILKREAAAAWAAIEELRAGPIAMPKDQEWTTFIRLSDQLVDPDVPIRQFQFLSYPGQDHFACQEIRAGLLERKSKYLKSYTAGWYVLSPTHLHEFKSADKMQAPVMSLYLPEQKLGSHSTETASSSKFVLKGRQSGGLHRGHTWVFRAESYDTMMAWYEDIHALTEKSPQEREEYARGHQHTRSVSRASQRTYSSDGVNEDDDEPFAVGASTRAKPAAAVATAAAAGVAAGTAAGVAMEDGGSLRAMSGSGQGGGAVGSRGVSPSGTDAGQPAYQAYQAYHPSAQYQQEQQYVPYQQYQAYPQQQQQQQPLPTAALGAEQTGAALAIAGTAAVAAEAGATTPIRRPTQGGRFASDLQVNAQRGLEVQAAGIPLSPTSAEEGSGSGRSSDYGVLAAAGSLPGTNLAPLNGAEYAYPPEAQGHQQQPQQPQQLAYPVYAATSSVVPEMLQPATAPGPVVPQGSDDGATEGVRLTNGSAAAATVNGDSGRGSPAASETLVAEPGTAAVTAPVVEKTSRVFANKGGAPAAAAGQQQEKRPDTLLRKESDGTTLANMHIPGQYPALSESR